jgi:hypothetical protein
VQVSQAGLWAAIKMWPEVFREDMSAPLEALKPQMRELRPTIVNGFECMVMARLLYEGQTVQQIASQWSALLTDSCIRFRVTTSELDAFFEDFRYGEAPACPCRTHNQLWVERWQWQTCHHLQTPSEATGCSIVCHCPF